MSIERGEIPDVARGGDATSPTTVTPNLLRSWPLPEPTGTKYSRGQRLVIGGDRSTPGAAMLSGQIDLVLASHSRELPLGAVQQALERLMHGRTTLVIAHRLSTVRDADLIVAMSQGRVCEIGTHEELLARDGIYAGLHAMQFREESERHSDDAEGSTT